MPRGFLRLLFEHTHIKQCAVLCVCVCVCVCVVCVCVLLKGA